jgi:hypothetical protein
MIKPKPRARQALLSSEQPSDELRDMLEAIGASMAGNSTTCWKALRWLVEAEGPIKHLTGRRSGRYPQIEKATELRFLEALPL